MINLIRLQVGLSGGRGRIVSHLAMMYIFINPVFCGEAEKKSFPLRSEGKPTAAPGARGGG